AVWHLDEPVADPSALGLYFLAREARKSVKVVLSGEGSDEFFGGYNIYLAPIAAKRLAWLPESVLRFLSKLPLRGSNFATRGLLKLEDWYIGNASIFKNEELANLWRGDEMSKAPFDIKALFKEVEGQSDSTKMQYIDINTWLVGDILAKADKMTMAHSLELRVPFLDVEVAKLAATLPDRFKWRRGTTKYLLREAFASILPESTRKRKKLGFPTPVREWFTPERSWIPKLVLENEYVKSHFNLEAVEQLFTDHFEKKTDNSRKIYLLLVLSIWYNTFIAEIT
ncbi:MAG: asparagine synthase C-terminal domain-containing protein, partial [Patescibacteria group bacterium]